MKCIVKVDYEYEQYIESKVLFWYCDATPDEVELVNFVLASMRRRGIMLEISVYYE